MRYTMHWNYLIFSRMKERGLSMVAFVTTVMFLILTVLMVTVTVQSAYAWIVMGSTLFLFVTMCGYSSCEKKQWQQSETQSDSISTISDGSDIVAGEEHNRNILPYWITDLPPSYAAATSEQDENATGRISPNIPPPPYTVAVENPTTGQSSPTDPSEHSHSTAPSEQSHSTEAQHQHQHQNGNIHTPDTLILYQPRPHRASVNSLQNCRPPERTHSLPVPKNAVRSSPDCRHNTHSLDRHLAECRKKKMTEDSSSVC